MTLEEAARQFKMPLDDLKKMKGEGLLSDPLAPGEINNLSFLSYFWDDPFWIQRQLMQRNRKARIAFIRTVDLSKTETYIFNRYYNARKGRHLSVSTIASELNKYYGVPVTKDLKKKIYAIRKKAQDARHYYSRKSRNKDSRLS